MVEGDLVFFSHRDSFISWIVRYLTRTDISHCGVYVGNGEVVHATLSGSRFDKLQYFFDWGYSIIPVSMQACLRDEKSSTSINKDDWVGIRYPLRYVVLRGIRFIVGVPWRKFRLTYLFDVLLTFSLVSLLISRDKFFILLSCLYTPYLAAVFIAFLYRTKLRIPISDPGEGFYFLPKESNVIPSVKKMNEPWFIDVFMRRTGHGPGT